MLSTEELRAVLQRLRGAADEVEAHGGYNVPFQAGYGHTLVRVGFRFGLVWVGADGGPWALTSEGPPDGREGVSARLAEVLRQLAADNRAVPADEMDDLECQQGREAALVAVAEGCGLDPGEIGRTRRCT